MSAKRQYQLLCPIARALDVVGDRWALLILRDLHAGPARFQELEEGLGVAANLLTTRLAELAEAGLIHRPDGRRRGNYELTALGHATDRLLWELSRFGSLLELPADPRRPGNLRTIALPLRITLQSVDNRPNLTVRLLVDDEPFTIASTADDVLVKYGDAHTPADLVARTDYEGFLGLSDARLTLEEFIASHLDLIDGSRHAPAFLAMMTTALANSKDLE